MGVRVIQPLQPRRPWGEGKTEDLRCQGWSSKISEMDETNGEMSEMFWHLSGFMTAIFEEQARTCCLRGFLVHKTQKTGSQ